MANIIKIKQSSVSGKIPLSADLQQGELALNTLDEKIYTKNSSGVVVQLNGASSSDMVGDTTPQLGGDLDLNGKNVTGTGNITITGNITATNLLNSVNVTTPANDQMLKYNSTSSKWENVTVTIPTFTESTTEPSSPSNGDTWYDTEENNVYIRVSGTWIIIANIDNTTGYDGGDVSNTVYTGILEGGNATTTTYTESIDGGSA